MDDEIEPVPRSVERGEGGVDGSDVLHVAGQHESGAERAGERGDASTERLALVGEGELRPVRGKDLGDAPGDGMVVRDAHDQAALALHQTAHLSLPLGSNPGAPARRRGALAQGGSGGKASGTHGAAGQD